MVVVVVVVVLTAMVVRIGAVTPVVQCYGRLTAVVNKNESQFAMELLFNRANDEREQRRKATQNEIAPIHWLCVLTFDTSRSCTGSPADFACTVDGATERCGSSSLNELSLSLPSMLFPSTPFSSPSSLFVLVFFVSIVR